MKEMFMMENNSVVLLITGVLCGLDNSLQALKDVESQLELEDVIEVDHNGLRLVVGTLKDMVEKLVSDIKAKPEIQKLVISQETVSGAGNNNALVQDPAITNQPCNVVVTPFVEAACIPSSYTRKEKRCHHTCEYHPEVIDPELWSKLPEKVVEIVYGRLPLARIVNLWNESGAWSSLSTSSRQIAAKRHMKMFGLVRHGDEVCMEMYDIELNEWCMTQAPQEDLDLEVNGYDDSMYACDGGLVCIIPQVFFVNPILIGNPLTDKWNLLPRLALDNKEAVLVQMVMDQNKKAYEVMLVYRDKAGGDLVADCYNSGTGEWSKMDSGLIYGGSHNLECTSMNAPCVFDCATTTLFKLSECHAFRYVSVRQFAMVHDRVLVLQDRSMTPNCFETYELAEYVWDNLTLDLRRVRVIDGAFSPNSPRCFDDILLFASSGFVIVCGGSEYPENEIRLTRLYDSSTNVWHSLAADKQITYPLSILRTVYMCELQWDAVP